jgi:lipopolysaccharide export LptBFGC system permease protein LptF
MAKRMTREKILVSAIGLGVLAAVVTLAFNGYVHPAMLIDFANIRICS